MLGKLSLSNLLQPSPKPTNGSLSRAEAEGSQMRVILGHAFGLPPVSIEPADFFGADKHLPGSEVIGHRGLVLGRVRSCNNGYLQWLVINK